MNLIRRDPNHGEIVAALLAAGCLVYDAAHVGGGFPDLVVFRQLGGGWRTWLLEVKDGSKPPSARRLSPAEKVWHAQFPGCAGVVLSVEDALRAVGLLRSEAA